LGPGIRRSGALTKRLGKNPALSLIGPNPRSGIAAIELALVADLLLGVGGSGGIETAPSALLVERSAVAEIDRGAVEDRLAAGALGIGHTRGHQRAAAANALGIDIGVFFADAGLGQRANEAAGRAAGNGERRRRGQPASRHNGTEPRYRQQPEAGEETRRAAERGADAGARSGALGAVLDPASRSRAMRPARSR